MIIKTTKPFIIYQAAGEDLRVEVNHLSANRFNVRLGLKTRKFQRKGSGGQRLDLVCFHGYLQFFQRLFELDPCAEVKSSLCSKLTAHNFLRFKHEIYSLNVGSLVKPMLYGTACFCDGK